MPLVIQDVRAKDSLTPEAVSELTTFYREEFIPAAERVEGIRSVRFYLGREGGFVGLFEMDDFSSWDRLLADPAVGVVSAKSWDWTIVGRAEVLYDLPVIDSLLSS